MSMNSRAAISFVALGAMALGYFGGRPLLEKMEYARAAADVQSTRQELSSVEDLSTVFRHVGKVVEPSVVKIEAHKTVKPDSSADSPDEQLRRFFEDHGGPEFHVPTPQPYEEIGTGSGVIMETDGTYGYILTNNHVAGDTTSIEVTLADGRVIHNADCKVLGADPRSDLAVVRIKSDRLIPAAWGNSDELEPGDWVLAFGAPFGYVGSMTHGIVSALQRTQVGIIPQGYEDFIQVDAPINPGNSGGPLVNIHGEVVGINTAIATHDGGFQGIGFAIPSNQAKPVYESLKEHGSVVRGWLGISMHNVSEDPDLASSFGYTGTKGVVVDEVAPSGPCAGKLLHGDIIVGFNGQDVTDNQQLRNLVADAAPNSKTTLKVFRDGATQDVDIVLGVQPKDMEAAFQPGAPTPAQPGIAQAASGEVLGMTLTDLDKDTATKLGIVDGALVTDVKQDSVAFKKGIQPGDVITEVFKTPIHNAQDAITALKDADLTKGVRLYVVSKDPDGNQFSRFMFLKNEDQ
jgi:serine protease Do